MNRSFYCDDRTVVEIKTGKVRGCYHNGVYYFRGIPYAKAERFMMPTPAESWEGIRDAVTYGRVCCTTRRPDCTGTLSLASEPLFGYRFRPEGEDCQSINVWTNNISGKAGKKPVMVWIHGGSFTAGSSVEQLSYEGENQARDNDVVVVSFNHRLNILGFLDLSEYGEKYKMSRNVGMADIVMALQWVQDNISAFGGDPDNVTIFGQSGGGGKVMTLLQMPCAVNLFHKCIIQSGTKYNSYDDEKTVADGKILAAAIVKQLGLTPETIDDIANFTFDELRLAYEAVIPEMKANNIDYDWSPKPDGEYYMGSLLEAELTEKALTTPMLFGNTAAETCLFSTEFITYDIPEEEKMALLKGKFGDDFDTILPLFKKAYPQKDLMHLYYMDCGFRHAGYYLMAKRGSAAPTYNYLLDYDFGYKGTTPSYHGAELPLVFNNTDLVDAFCEPDAQALGIKMSTAWANFARTGNPGVSTLPKWEPCTDGNCSTMVFGHTCEAKGDYDRALINALAPHFPLVPYWASKIV